MRRLFATLAVVVLFGTGVLAAILGSAHLAIRAIKPPLPTVAEILADPPSSADLPIRLRYINTASQAMPRSGVLEPSLDPNPDAPYVMAFPSFVLEWADGRLFLIDLGMERSSAVAFGGPSELGAGADPIVPHASVAERLGDARARVAGVGFTHLHVDHTDGATRLCAASPAAVSLFQTALQTDESNYTTSAAREGLEAARCLDPVRLAGGPIHEIPGFPGLSVIATGGHTPGSQLFVAKMAASSDVKTSHVKTSHVKTSHVKTWVFTGDLVNNIAGVRLNLPKPTLYSLLLVPEHSERLDLLRRLLRELLQAAGVELLVSHDQLQIEASSIEPMAAPLP